MVVTGSGSTGSTGAESIQPLTGNLTVSIPVAHLPPGPGGFTAGVNLVYNSTIFDLVSGPHVIAGFPDMTKQEASTSQHHGGGWITPSLYPLVTGRASESSLSVAACPSQAQRTASSDWFKTYLRTPDGGNHVLRIVSVIKPDGKEFMPDGTALTLVNPR